MSALKTWAKYLNDVSKSTPKVTAKLIEKYCDKDYIENTLLPNWAGDTALSDDLQYKLIACGAITVEGLYFCSVCRLLSKTPGCLCSK